MMPRPAFIFLNGPFISSSIAYYAYLLGQWHDNASHIRIANRNLRSLGTGMAVGVIIVRGANSVPRLRESYPGLTILMPKNKNN